MNGAAAPPQLTVRAVATGMVIGAVLCAANVYVVLRTGWSLGVTLTSTVIAFGVFRALRAVGLVRRPLGTLENTTVSSVASAAAFMTGGGNMAALPALLMLTGARPSAAALVLWFGVIAALGVVLAIPLKRQLLDEDRLPFPLGVATATTLRAMHDEPGARGAGSRPSRVLFAAAAVAAAATLVRSVRAVAARIPSQVGLPISLAGHPAASYSLGLDLSFVLVGGGALMSMRAAASMAATGALTFGALAPWLVSRGAVARAEYADIVGFTVWPGAALLATSGVASLAGSARSILRALAALPAALRGSAPGSPASPAADEAPARWFVIGVAVLGPAAAALMAWLFDVPLWAGILAVPLALGMGVIAGRVTGETDMSPTKALGPLTQLLYGALLPGHLTANLMSANVVGGVGLHAGDLLTDLKAGQLVGASPRRQVIAQLFGVAVGAVAVVPAFELLVPTASALGTRELPAPAVLVWASVSRALSGGLAGIPPAARLAAAGGALLGVLLAVLERGRARAFVPSAAAVGIAMIMPASTSAAMFTGAALAAVARRARAPAQVVTTVGSGLVAGESVAGMAVALARALG